MKLQVQTLFVAIGLGIKRNWHIFLAIIAGIIFGNYIYEHTVPKIVEEILVFTGQAFIRLIQMVVIPLVCSAVVVGISSLGDSKQIGKLGKRMIVYYAIITFAAVSLGAILASTIQPGVGAKSYIETTTQNDPDGVVMQRQIKHIIEMSHDANESDDLTVENKTDNQTIENLTLDNNSVLESHSEHTGKLFLNMIPQNPLESLAKGEMIPIIFFALIFALALSKVGEINRPIVSLFESVFAATMKITDWIMILAAPGIFALTAVSVANCGLGVFSMISKLLGVIFLGFLIQFFVVYPLMLKIFSKVPVTTFYIAIIEALLVAFGTASSSATLPLTIACCEKRGISHKVCSFVLPLGATLNMDGTALFQVVCVLFLMQAYGFSYDLPQVFLIMGLAVISSSTSAGIPSGGLITLAVVLSKFGLDAEMLAVGFGFIFVIERIADMLRTTVNVASDAVVSAIIADNENEIDYDLLNNTDKYNEII